MALVDYLPLLSTMLISALIGILCLLWYVKTRRAGFVLIGAGFLVSIVPSLIRLALGGPYLVMRLALESGMGHLEIGGFLFMLYVVDTATAVAFALLVLAGLVLFARDFRK